MFVCDDVRRIKSGFDRERLPRKSLQPEFERSRHDTLRDGLQATDGFLLVPRIRDPGEHRTPEYPCTSGVRGRQREERQQLHDGEPEFGRG